MGKRIFVLLFLVVVVLLIPLASFGQGISGSLQGMQPVLDQVYGEMMPLCTGLIDVARGLAGFGALWYIGSRVWRQIAAAEAIDFYPLLRPFALGLAILLFPMVIGLMNGVLEPTVSATGAMVKDSGRAIDRLLAQKEAALKKTKKWQMYIGDSGSGNREQWYKYRHPKDPGGQDESFLQGISNDMSFFMERQGYNFRNSIKAWMSEVLEVLYAAAALCINVIRTFMLVVMAILGPLVFGFAVFDGFQQTLTVWIARYINIFLWLPIANIYGSILGKVQEQLIKLDISQLNSDGETFFSAGDITYLLFLVMGIVGYFCVPSVANYVVHAGGGNPILQRVNSMITGTTSAGIRTASAGAGMAADAFGNQVRGLRQGEASESTGDYFPDGGKGHQQGKISGK